MTSREVIDSIEVTIADSFVDPANKFAATKGNGEFRLYGGYWTSELANSWKKNENDPLEMTWMFEQSLYVIGFKF